MALITDTRRMKIPNMITLPALVSGILVQIMIKGLDGLIFAACGAGTGFILLLIMYVIGAVGAGDVKLFAGIGAWMGFIFTLQAIMYSILFGAVIGWIIVLGKGEAGNRLRSIAGRTGGFLLLRKFSLQKGNSGTGLLRFPFMLAVVPGFICTYLYL
ncbi:A24 family peptidase [Paenibacillus sp. PK3_47]|uniref:A24 family peptidase n=1 Tax=Paenibacillus sp. PK3_47 TaxID=2072642 RepID=UPI00201E6CA9|nr:A24 family peptidase [Paenibacillus sp. PK3_47]